MIVGLFAASAALLVAVVVAELVQAEPMFDLALFRKPTFAGASIAAFTVSSSMFAMFLYLTLYLQTLLGLSPLQTGLRFLPVTVVAFGVSAVSGNLSTRVPVRLLLSGGLLLVGVGLLLMRGLTASSHWTALLAGFILAGAGVGLINPALASTAIGVVPPQRSGMASGINSTFRQVGIATGIAALGAIFASKVGDLHSRAAFVHGLHDILLVGAGVAAIGAVLAGLLVRPQDFVASGPPPQAEAQTS
jgi:predicted MFS family arabinose efflux permease